MKEIPEAMLEAAIRALGIKRGFEIYSGAHRDFAKVAIQAALDWREENPVTPNPQRVEVLADLYRSARMKCYELTRTMAMAGDHYTYRDLHRANLILSEMAERELIGLLGYEAGMRRLSAIGEETWRFDLSERERLNLPCLTIPETAF